MSSPRLSPPPVDRYALAIVQHHREADICGDESLGRRFRPPRAAEASNVPAPAVILDAIRRADSDDFTRDLQAHASGRDNTLDGVLQRVPPFGTSNQLV